MSWPEQLWIVSFLDGSRFPSLYFARYNSSDDGAVIVPIAITLTGTSAMHESMCMMHDV
jgi:hypothetical protein